PVTRTRRSAQNAVPGRLADAARAVDMVGRLIAETSARARSHARAGVDAGSGRAAHLRQSILSEAREVSAPMARKSHEPWCGRSPRLRVPRGVAQELGEVRERLRRAYLVKPLMSDKTRKAPA